MIAVSSTTPRIFRKEECFPAGVLKITAEMPIAGVIAVARPFIDLRQRDVLTDRNARQLRIVTALKLDGVVKSPISALRFILRHCGVP